MATTIHVRFATNRNRVSGSELFGTSFEGGDATRYVTGTIDVVRLSSLPDTGWTPLSETLAIDPPSPALEARWSHRPKRTRPPSAWPHSPRTGARRRWKNPSGYGIILLPGFASTLSMPSRRAAQIAFAYRAADIFCFSWPANGQGEQNDYRLDRRDAEEIGPGDRRRAGPVPRHHRRHAEGAAANHPWPAIPWARSPFGRRSRSSAASSRSSSRRGHSTGLLLAADEDDDALPIQQARPLVKLARRVSVYTAGGDLALGVSQIVNGKPRLGHGGPRNLASLPKSVTRIDCSDVAATQGDHGETHFSHQYYRLAPRVIADIVQVLAGTPPNAIAGRLADPTNRPGAASRPSMRAPRTCPARSRRTR
jgi:hypothetical protein